MTPYSFVSATILLLLITDPLGNIPVFVAGLKSVRPARRPWVIVREVSIAFIILLTFMFIGEGFLRAMNLSDLALQLAGSVVLFLIALRMVFPPEQRNATPAPAPNLAAETAPADVGWLRSPSSSPWQSPHWLVHRPWQR